MVVRKRALGLCPSSHVTSRRAISLRFFVLPPFFDSPHRLGRIIMAWLGLVTFNVFELMALSDSGIGGSCGVSIDLSSGGLFDDRFVIRPGPKTFLFSPPNSWAGTPSPPRLHASRPRDSQSPTTTRPQLKHSTRYTLRSPGGSPVSIPPSSNNYLRRPLAALLIFHHQRLCVW